MTLPPLTRAESVDANIRDLAMLISTIAERCWPDLGADESRRIMVKALEVRAEAEKRAKPRVPAPSTVSKETADKRMKAALDHFGPMIEESVRITRELNEHANGHEWGAVADCRSCQEEKAKT